MTLYETIFTRRQVRKFEETLLEEDVLADIRQCIQEAEQLGGQQVKVELATKNEVTGGQGAPYYLLSYCDKISSAYANAGFVLQKADLYIQSMELGSGIKRVLLQKKLNKIDLGIAARHAVLALLHEGNTVTEIIPKETGKLFEMDITYR